jgi:hypothetical protein
MTFENQYFRLARNEETAGNLGAALLLYLSSFCSAYNSGNGYPCGAVAKVRKMQLALNLSDEQVQGMIRSYGPLSDQDCRLLLDCSVRGDAAGIHSILTGSSYGC